MCLAGATSSEWPVIPEALTPALDLDSSQTAVTMPKLTRQTLAVRLRQNWVSKHPQDLPPTACLNMPLDDSLTSLSWLHNLNILKLTPPSEQGGNPPGGAKESPVTPPGEEAPKLEVNINPNAILNMSQLMTDPDLTPLTPVSPLPTLLPPAFPGVLEAVDYTMNPYMKPPYSYATLICMAMRQSEKKKITLAGIYSWIQENYMYYRTSDPSWQVSYYAVRPDRQVSYYDVRPNWQVS